MEFSKSQFFRSFLKITGIGFSLLLDIRCPGCEARSYGGVCTDCLALSPCYFQWKCLYCNRLGEDLKQNCCRFPFPVFSQFEYSETARRLMTRIKFQRESIWLKHILNNAELDLKCPLDSILVPVPLHPLRRMERGFNTADIISEHLSATSGLNIERSVLYRKKKKRAQTLSRRQERVQNVQKVFAVRSGGLQNRNQIILVDDVLTTGATLKSCQKVLGTNAPVMGFSLFRA